MYFIFAYENIFQKGTLNAFTTLPKESITQKRLRFVFCSQKIKKHNHIYCNSLYIKKLPVFLLRVICSLSIEQEPYVIIFGSLHLKTGLQVVVNVI